MLFRSSLARSKSYFWGSHNVHFEKYSRKNHRYKLGSETLIEGLLLSDTAVLLCDRSNISRFAFLNSNKKNKYSATHPHLDSWAGQPEKSKILSFNVFSSSNSPVLELLQYTGNKKLTLTISGIKKLLPYKGFYPSERTAQLVSLFQKSFFNVSTSL